MICQSCHGYELPCHSAGVVARAAGDVLSRFSGEEAELLPIFQSRGLTSEGIVAYTLLQPAAFLIKVRFLFPGDG